MAKTDEKVMAAVEAELEKNPDAALEQLYQKAQQVNKDVAKLSKRQFNARYPLQVKRRKKLAAGGGRRSTRKKSSGGGRKASAAPRNGEGRDAVRAAFMRFASDMAAAEERKDLVKFLAGVDAYVDQVMKATGSK